MFEILFCNHYFSPLNTFIRNGKDPDPESVIVTYGSGSGTLVGVIKATKLRFCIGLRVKTVYCLYLSCTVPLVS